MHRHASEGRGRGAEPRRALLWMLAGLLVLALLVVVSAPELLNVPGAVGRALLLVLAPGVPGLLLVAALSARRRRGRQGDGDE